MGALPCIGISKTWDIENHLEAANDAIVSYLKEENKDIFSVIIIIKSYTNLSLNKVNEVFELVQAKLNYEEISCNMSEVKDEILKNKIEIILIGE